MGEGTGKGMGCSRKKMWPYGHQMLIQKNIYPPTNVGQDPDAESLASVYQCQAESWR